MARWCSGDTPVFQTGEDRIVTGTGYMNMDLKSTGELVKLARGGDPSAIKLIKNLYENNEDFMTEVFPDVVKEFIS